MKFKNFINTLSEFPVITFVGDIMQHPNQLEFESKRDYSYDGVFDYITPLFKGSDMVIGNLETTFGEYLKVPETRSPKFSAPKEFAIALKKAGFTHLTLCNNHMFDREYKGFLDTIRILKEVGIIPIYNSYSEIIKNKRIQIINFTTHFNTSSVSKNIRDTFSNYEYQSNAEIKVAFPHWGNQYNLTPSKEQIDIGINLKSRGYYVFGSGPHSVNKIEDGIDYSMGDFLASHEKPGTTNVGQVITATFGNTLELKVHYIETITNDGKSVITILD
jgi:poly-gamma-glutamate synthesis protein (capsule biosynthesis protein)